MLPWIADLPGAFLHGAAAAAYCSVRLRSHSKVAIRITKRIRHCIDKTLLTALKYNICCIWR